MNVSGAEKTEGGSGRLIYAAAGRLLALAASYMLSVTPVFGGIYPFDTAYIASLGRRDLPAALIGAAAAYFYGRHSLSGLAAVLVAGGIRWTLSELRPITSRPMYPPAAAFFSVVLGRIAEREIAGRGLSGLAWTGAALTLCEAALSALCAYFFSRCFIALRRARDPERRGKHYCFSGADLPRGTILPGRGSVRSGAVRLRNALADMRGGQLIPCLFCACVFSVPLCRITLGGFSPFALALLLVAALSSRVLSVPEAALAGTLAGSVLSLSSGDMSFAGMVAAAAAAAAAANTAGFSASRYIVPCVFSVICAAASLSSGGIDVFFLAQSAIAGAACAAFPPPWLERLKAALIDGTAAGSVDRDAPPDDAAWGISRRLRRAADGLAGVSELVLEVSSRLDALDTDSPAGAALRRMNAICDCCGMYSFCRVERAEETGAFLAAMAEKLSRSYAAPEDLPPYCARRGELAGALSEEYRGASERERIHRRVSRVRSAVEEQTVCVAGLIGELADVVGTETENGQHSFVTERNKAYGVLERFGFAPSSVHIISGSPGWFRIVLDTGGAKESISDDMIYELSDALDWELDVAEDDQSGAVVISRSAPLRAVFGTCQRTRGGMALCGDAYETMVSDDGCAVIILSDGMGTGGRAAIDAAMTCGLIRRLLYAGFGLSRALELANTALMMRTEDESIATVDILRVDLFSGSAALEKAGAAASFLRHGGSVRIIDGESLPLGIMERVDSASERIMLERGDILLQVSDGVIGEGDTGWIERILSGFDAENGDLRALAEAIADSAPGAGKDDVTAIAVRLEALQQKKEA